MIKSELNEERHTDLLECTRYNGMPLRFYPAMNIEKVNEADERNARVLWVIALVDDIKIR